MRMPCVVFISDQLDDFFALMDTIRPICKVFTRTSVQGEQLYQEREGILYFDEENHRQQVWREDYDNVATRVAALVEKSISRNTTLKALVKKYQSEHGNNK